MNIRDTEAPSLPVGILRRMVSWTVYSKTEVEATSITEVTTSVGTLRALDGADIRLLS